MMCMIDFLNRTKSSLIASQLHTSVMASSKLPSPEKPPCTTNLAAYALLAPQPHARNLGAFVPIGDRGVARGSACGSDCYETRREPRALRLLAGKARDPPSAGTHGDRAGRHSRRAGRCVHPGARPRLRPSHPVGRHAPLRPFRP